MRKSIYKEKSLFEFKTVYRCVMYIMGNELYSTGWRLSRFPTFWWYCRKRKTHLFSHFVAQCPPAASLQVHHLLFKLRKKFTFRSVSSFFAFHDIPCWEVLSGWHGGENLIGSDILCVKTIRQIVQPSWIRLTPSQSLYDILSFSKTNYCPDPRSEM